MYLKVDSAAIFLRLLVCLDLALDRWPSYTSTSSGWKLKGRDNLLEVWISGFIHLFGKVERLKRLELCKRVNVLEELCARDATENMCCGGMTGLQCLRSGNSNRLY
jgi:hypothetical protein